MYTFGKDSSPFILAFLHRVRGGHICFSCRAGATEKRPEEGKGGHRLKRCDAEYRRRRKLRVIVAQRERDVCGESV